MREVFPIRPRRRAVDFSADTRESADPIPARGFSDFTESASNVSHTPVGVSGCVTPFTLLEKTICRDSGGVGKFRGGCGQRIVFRNDSPARIAVSFMAEHTKSRARGQVRVNDDTLALITPGGGGYGEEGR